MTDTDPPPCAICKTTPTLLEDGSLLHKDKHSYNLNMERMHTRCAELEEELEAEQARVEEARQLYIKLTNSDLAEDPDTGAIFYCADKHLMSKFDDLFEEQPEGGE